MDLDMQSMAATIGVSVPSSASGDDSGESVPPRRPRCSPQAHLRSSLRCYSLLSVNWILLQSPLLGPNVARLRCNGHLSRSLLNHHFRCGLRVSNWLGV
ncbi:hypothetical protein LINPERPRIM_LOCUS22512 [Linum perenne]